MKFEYKKNIFDLDIDARSKEDVEYAVRSDICKQLTEYLMSRNDLMIMNIDDRGNIYACISMDKFTDQSKLAALTYNNTEAIKSILQSIKDTMSIIGVDLAKSADKTGGVPGEYGLTLKDIYPDFENRHEAQKQAIVSEMTNGSPPKPDDIQMIKEGVLPPIDTDIFENGGYHRPVSYEDKKKLNDLFGCGAGKPGA